MNFTTEDFNGHGIHVIGIGQECYIHCSFFMREQQAFFDAMERCFGEDMYRVQQDSGETIISIHRTMDGAEFMEKINEIFYDNVKGD